MAAAAFKQAGRNERETHAPSQRWYVLIAFCALQAYKLLWRATGSFKNFCLLDFAFLCAVYFAQVPWLSFRFGVFLVVFLILACENALLLDFTLLKLPLLFMLKLSGKQLSVTGSRVHPESHEQIARHYLQGKYTVNYLPELSATLTADESLCVRDGEAVYFHLMLNNTSPSLVVLASKPFGEGDELSNVSFNAKQLTRVPASTQDSIAHYYLPIYDAGLYRLESVLDTSGTQVQAHGKLIIVPPCPSAEVLQTLELVCVGTPFSSEISLFGIPPFTVVLDKSVFTVGQSNDYQLESILAPVNVDTSKRGTLSTKVVAVRDALDNWSNFTSSASVNVVSPPSIQLESPHQLALLGDKVTAVLKAQGEDPPYTLTYSAPNGEELTTVLTSNHARIDLTQVGEYKLLKFTGSLCSSGSIRGQNTIKVFDPPMVELDVQFQSLQEQCSGPSGTDADLRIKGTAPFTVWYEIVSLDSKRVIQQQVKDTTETTAQVLFKPYSIGNFEYRFTALADKYRKVQLEGNKYKYTQTIEELAGATFQSGPRTSYCPNDEVVIDASVQGKGPFKLVYEVDGKRHTLEDVADRVRLYLGALSGGQHRVMLKSMTDVQGCTTKLDVRSPIINVRSQVASAKLTGPKMLKVYSPRISLPLAVDSANSKFTLKYSINGTTNATATLTEPALPITQPGTYQLLSIDDGCPGTVGREHVEVSVYERPTVHVLEHQEAVCLDTRSELLLGFTGEPPFKLWSEVVDPKGHSSFEEHMTSNMRIKLVNRPRELPGTYKHYYWITDNLFKDTERRLGALVVEQKIWQEPVVMHAKPAASYQLCQNKNAKQGIPITLQGAAPFVVTVELTDMRTGAMKLHKVEAPTSGRFELTEPFEDLSGAAKVRLVSVKDSRGCVGSAIASKSIVTVASVHAPHASPERAEYCLNEHVRVALEGEGPFKLGYSLNNRKHSVSSNAASVGLLASKPGVLHLNSLEDSSPCPAGLNSTIIVHDLPSSRITRRPSFNIHKGDDAVELQFAFTGVPPFKFVYTRSVAGREVERHTVDNVREHIYSIYVDENGVYEVVALYDAHCSVSI